MTMSGSVEVKYLEWVKLELEVDSDYALARALGVTPQHISQIRKGRAGIGVLLATKIAEAVGVEPMAVIGATQLSQGKDADESSIWKKYIQHGAHAVALAGAVSILLGAVLPEKANAANGLAPAKSLIGNIH
jgi:plasmid maintenance system antidote protein VapI